MRTHIILAGLVILVATLAAAQEAQDEPELGFDLALGVVSFVDPETGDSITYQQIGLQPDLAIGRFGIGLNLEINYRFTAGEGDEFEVRREDWVPTGNRTILDLYLPKIDYARYGVKGEPLFVQFGTLPSVTLGNGFIVDGYSNGLYRPQRRVFGGVLDLDGPLFGLPYAGFETLVANVAAWDLLAGRVFIRPLAGTEIPVLSGLQVGTTLAADRDPWYHLKLDQTPDNPYLSDSPPSEVPDRAALVWGADLRLPVISSALLDLVVFSDVIRQNGRTGGMIGGSGRAVGFILFGAQARLLDDNVVPSYFNSSYDLRRADLYRIWNDEEELPGGAGWLGSLGFALPSNLIVFNTTVSGRFSPEDGNNPELRSSLVVAEGAVPGFAGLSAEGYYEKFNLTRFSDLWTAEDAVIGARLNVRSGPVIISLVYDIVYDPLAETDPWIVSAGLETTISF